MTPGRDLDALVAEKVMGYRRKRDDCNTYWVDSEGEEPSHSHEYSTDMAAAWSLVDKISNIRIETNGLKWFVFSRGSHSEELLAVSDTAPHAICLAALKAVGVEI